MGIFVPRGAAKLAAGSVPGLFGRETFALILGLEHCQVMRTFFFHALVHGTSLE
jgi:hypothetical protein